MRRSWNIVRRVDVGGHVWIYELVTVYAVLLIGSQDVCIQGESAVVRICRRA